MTNQRDFQRSKVYSWERTRYNFREALSLGECKQLATQLYGKRVKVKDGRGRRGACAYWDRYPTIAIPRPLRCPEVVAHEVAHLMFRNTEVPWHGALWLKEYIKLLGCIGYDTFDLKQDARAYGLKVAD